MIQNELVKTLLFEQDCTKSLLEGVKKIAHAVKVTLGFAGRTVVIESPDHTNGIHTTKDGWTVAKSVVLQDPTENLACKIMKECAERTATSAGDGSSTSIILAEALVLNGVELITPEVNKTQVLRELSNAANDVIEILAKDKIDCTDKILLDVAKISCNNDEELGGYIAEAYKGVGKDGIVTVEKSINHNTYFEVINGLKIDRGWSSPLFQNNREKEECTLENVCVLVCDTEISTHLQLKNVFDILIPTGKRLLIIAPCSPSFIGAMITNFQRNTLGVCIIQPPDFGYRQHDLMSDIAISVGAKYFSQKTGDDLSVVKFEDLGFASKVVVGKNRTILTGTTGDKNLIKKTAEELKHTISNQKRQHEIDFINHRIATLIGGIGTIFIGGNSDLEQKEMIDRADDSVLAVRSALEEGIIAGAGKPLFDVELSKGETPERNIANQIMLKAIKEPLIQILKNADLDAKEIYLDIMGKGFGYNLKTGEYGDLIEMGIIDPFKVTKSAILNSVSVAKTILSTNATITLTRA